jgi:hypothetical protein
MASLQDNLKEAHDPFELFEPMSPVKKALGWVLPAVGAVMCFYLFPPST